MSVQANYTHTRKLNNACDFFQLWCSISCTIKLSPAQLWPRPIRTLSNRFWAWLRSYCGQEPFLDIFLDIITLYRREFINTSATYFVPLCSNTKEECKLHKTCLYEHDSLICIMSKQKPDKQTSVTIGVRMCT